MPFSRSFLKNNGLTEEQVEAVMEEHNSVVEALKQQRDGYKADAEKLSGVQKELDDLKGGEDFKAKYEAEHSAFEKYKADEKAKAELANIKEAYRKLLADEKISNKWVEPIVRMEDFSAMKLDKDGNLTDVDSLRKAIQEKYPEYIVTEKTQHEQVATPPKGQGGKLTRDDIFKRDEHGRYVLSTEERQKAIAENPQAFR